MDDPQPPRSLGIGRFSIEELVQRDSDRAQVGESTDRGLDAQTPSGTEGGQANAPVAPAQPGPGGSA